MTFNEAIKIANKQFKKENIPLYIFEIKEISNKKVNYIISEIPNIVIDNNCSSALVKMFIPNKFKIRITEIQKYIKKYNMNLYINDNINRKYYKMDYYPTIIDYIKYKIVLINSTEGMLNYVGEHELFIIELESLEELCKKYKIKLFNLKIEQLDKILNLISTL
jgi:hypothetical protein